MKSIFILFLLLLPFVAKATSTQEHACERRVARAIRHHHLPLKRYLWEDYDIMGQEQIGFLLARGGRQCVATCGATRQIVCHRAGTTYDF